MSQINSDEDHGGSPTRIRSIEPLPDPSPPFALQSDEYERNAAEYYSQKHQMLLAAGSK